MWYLHIAFEPPISGFLRLYMPYEQRVGRKPRRFSIGMKIVLLDEWQVFRGVWGHLIRELCFVALGEIHAAGRGRIEVTPVEIRTATLLLAVQKQEASVLNHGVVHQGLC